MRAQRPAPTGTVTANTAMNWGTLNAVMVMAPTSTRTDESAAGPACCIMSSTFSTSRTTFDWMTAALAREWKPIDRCCSREVSELRRSASSWRLAPLYQRVNSTCVG
jgi:hypothetical protein